MVLRAYLWKRFAKNLLIVSFFFSLLLLISQLFSSIYLIFSIPFTLGFSYLMLLFIYTYFVALAFSLPLVVGFLIFHLKEYRFFHTIYTFGFSEKKILKLLWTEVFFFTFLGVIGSFFVNYEKVAHISKYLKFKFEEKLLSTVPAQSFFSTDEISFYFEKKTSKGFKKLIVRLGNEVGVAKKAQLKEGGILLLEGVSIFGKRKVINYLLKATNYHISLVGSYHYNPPQKKFKKETGFMLSIFFTPVLFFPLFFYLLLRFANSRLSTTLWSILFVVFQFAVSFLIKALI